MDAVANVGISELQHITLLGDIVVIIPTCDAEDPGSIPSRGN